MKLYETRGGWKHKAFMLSLSIHRIAARLKNKDIALVPLRLPLNLSDDDPRAATI